MKFYPTEGAVYLFLYDFCAVRLPLIQNPYSNEEWEAMPGLAYLAADLTKLTRSKPVNRLVAGPDDLYHLVRADDRSLEAWYSQAVFGLLEAKEDYDWHIDPKEKILYVTSEPMHQLELICSPVYVSEDDA